MGQVVAHTRADRVGKEVAGEQPAFVIRREPCHQCSADDRWYDEEDDSDRTTVVFPSPPCGEPHRDEGDCTTG